MSSFFFFTFRYVISWCCLPWFSSLIFLRSFRLALVLCLTWYDYNVPVCYTLHTAHIWGQIFLILTKISWQTGNISNGNQVMVSASDLALRLKDGSPLSTQVVQVPAGSLAQVDWASKLKVSTERLFWLVYILLWLKRSIWDCHKSSVLCICHLQYFFLYLFPGIKATTPSPVCHRWWMLNVLQVWRMLTNKGLPK